jgi:hypothetical protein
MWAPFIGLMQKRYEKNNRPGARNESLSFLQVIKFSYRGVFKEHDLREYGSFAVLDITGLENIRKLSMRPHMKRSYPVLISPC